MDKLKVLLKSKQNIAIAVLSFLLLVTLVSYPDNKKLENTVDTSTKNQLEELHSVNDKLEKQVEQDNAKINELQNAITSLEKDKQQLEDDKTNLQNQNNELNAKVKELQKTSSTKANTSTAVKDTVTNTSNHSSSSEPKKTTQSATSSSTTSSTYILNTSTKKFHRPGCSSIAQMKESNKQTSNSSRDSIISQGYSPCKKCNP